MQKVEQNFNPCLALIGLRLRNQQRRRRQQRRVTAKKGIGLDWHALCVFLAVTARLRRETA